MCFIATACQSNSLTAICKPFNTSHVSGKNLNMMSDNREEKVLFWKMKTSKLNLRVFEGF